MKIPFDEALKQLNELCVNKDDSETIKLRKVLYAACGKEYPEAGFKNTDPGIVKADDNTGWLIVLIDATRLQENIIVIAEIRDDGKLYLNNISEEIAKWYGLSTDQDGCIKVCHRTNKF